VQGDEVLRRLGFGEQDFYILAALKAVSLSTVEELWGTDMFEYVLKNVLFELLDTACFRVESVFCTPEGVWFMVCRFSGMTAPDVGMVEEVMEQVRKVCREKIHFDTICAVGAVCGEAGLPEQFAKLREMMENALEDDGNIRYLKDYKPVPYSYVTPDISIWESLLKENQKEQLRADIHEYVECKVAGGSSWQGAQAFRQDVTQMFYSFLRGAGIQAHKLFAGKQEETLYQRACNSRQGTVIFRIFQRYSGMWKGCLPWNTVRRSGTDKNSTRFSSGAGRRSDRPGDWRSSVYLEPGTGLPGANANLCSGIVTLKCLLSKALCTW
ncbi:MAG: hypothetical protein K2O13_02455, partial [Lachnospiraceae bacterium]|nr:hypothetical protein [Lachnospiraceae bacterium]